MIEHAESACITAALADPNLHLSLTPDHFVTNQGRMIWKAIQAAGRDIADVSKWLSRETGENWLPAILEITEAGFGSPNAESWADQLRGHHRDREASRIAQNLLTSLAGGRGEDSIAEAVKALQALQTQRSTDPSIGSATREAVEESRERKTVVPSGIPKLDRNTGGFHAGDLVVIGARTGVGKTALMMQFAMHAATHDNPVGIMSGEQCAKQLGLRALARLGAATVADIRAGRVNWDNLEPTLQQLDAVPCWINDTSGPTLATVQKAARKWVRDNGIKILFVDYIQRMRGDPRLPAHERVGECAKGLKTLATELDIPIVVLAQLNRQAADSAPNISQLKDSGQIEQEADQIFLLHCDDPDYNAERYPVNLNLEKNRHGPVLYFRLMWERARMSYREIDR